MTTKWKHSSLLNYKEVYYCLGDYKLVTCIKYYDRRCITHLTRDCCDCITGEEEEEEELFKRDNFSKMNIGVVFYFYFWF